jgi:hypothetical protein
LCINKDSKKSGQVQRQIHPLFYGNVPGCHPDVGKRLGSGLQML